MVIHKSIFRAATAAFLVTALPGAALAEAEAGKAFRGSELNGSVGRIARAEASARVLFTRFESARDQRQSDEAKRQRAISRSVAPKSGTTFAAPKVLLAVPTNTEADKRRQAQVALNVAYLDAVKAQATAKTAMTQAESAADTAMAALALAEFNLERFVHGYEGRSLPEIEHDIAALDEKDPANADMLLRLRSEWTLADDFENARAVLTKVATDAGDGVVKAMKGRADAELALRTAETAADTALDAATGGRELSSAEMGFFLKRIGL
jgi:hypothetical protein